MHGTRPRWLSCSGTVTVQSSNKERRLVHLLLRMNVLMKGAGSIMHGLQRQAVWVLAIAVLAMFNSFKNQDSMQTTLHRTDTPRGCP